MIRFKLKWGLILPVILLPLLFLSCASAGRAKLRLNDLKYPVSMSPYLFGPSGNLLKRGSGLRVVSHFQYEKTQWAILYGFLPVQGDSAWSREMNRQIQSNSGEGMVD